MIKHIIGDKLLGEIQVEVQNGRNPWIAYNEMSFHLEQWDMWFFETKAEALEFAANNYSDYDRFSVIHGGSVPEIVEQLGAETNSLNFKIMEEKAMAFNEGQLKRVGFAEAFTPDLRKKMEEGVALIQHPFQKQYDGDQVNATLHLKKSATSDYYFLNKFELELQKEGLANSIKQTFYLTKKLAADESAEGGQKSRLENKYTLKEAYSLLAGRPVFKNLVTNEGKEYQAWVKLNFKNQLENGNYEMKQFTANYGFDLEATLKHYPIKELLNAEYKKSLIDSLNRGNLQKVTFVSGEGKEEKLYVSPHITTGALAVYDLNKQRLTTETLVEKGYIGKELAEHLKQQFSQSHKPDQKQDQKQGQKQRATDAQKQKQSRKQKVHQ